MLLEEPLTDLRFADDTDIIESAVKEMESQSNQINRGSTETGLNMYKGKTTCITDSNAEVEIKLQEKKRTKNIPASKQLSS